MDSESSPTNEHAISESQPVATANTDGDQGEHRRRCELLGIAWHEKPVLADAAAVEARRQAEAELQAARRVLDQAPLEL